MPPRKVLGLVCLILTVLCLAIGHALAGRWIGFAAAWIVLFVWLAQYKWPSTELLTTALVLSIGLASIGLLAGALPILMLLAAAFSLANWDLTALDRDLAGDPSGQVVTPLEKKHFRNLGLALGLALPAILLGRFVRFCLPFIVMILLAALAVFSLVRLWRILSD